MEEQCGQVAIGCEGSILAHPEKYHVGRAIKLGDYNVGEQGQITTLPAYMAFLLTKV